MSLRAGSLQKHPIRQGSETQAHCRRKARGSKRAKGQKGKQARSRRCALFVQDARVKACGLAEPGQSQSLSQRSLVGSAFCFIVKAVKIRDRVCFLNGEKKRRGGDRSWRFERHKMSVDDYHHQAPTVVKLVQIIEWTTRGLEIHTVF